MRKGDPGRTDCRMLNERQRMEKEDIEKVIRESMITRK